MLEDMRPDLSSRTKEQQLLILSAVVGAANGSYLDGDREDAVYALLQLYSTVKFLLTEDEDFKALAESIIKKSR